jgi:Cof subfamily protein (haloacid dehalogenase superfamily)
MFFGGYGYMYKLIAIDIDGTLLNSYGEVSKENKDAIKMAIDRNVNVVLTSGRMPKAILPIANEICANKYIISGNGAAIYDVKNDKIIYNNYMAKEKVLEIIDICEKNSMFYNIYTNNAILTKTLNYNILFYHNENRKKYEDKKIKINIIEDMYSYIKNYDAEDFLKITICDDNKTIFNGIINKLKTIRDIDVLEVEHMSKKIIQHGTEEFEISYFYTEITNQNVNKWAAIKELIKILDIKEEEVLAIGDNINDKEMIENAGMGIVTANSSPTMKNIADEVVSSNNESGVAEAIERHVE